MVAVVVHQLHRRATRRGQARQQVEAAADALEFLQRAGDRSGADARSLARAIRTRGRIDPVVVNSASDLASVLPDILQDDDLLLVMGAGDIGQAAQQLAANGFDGGDA